MVIKIYIGSDHAGFSLKQKIKDYLEHEKIFYKDFGSFEKDEKDDYPDYILPVARTVAYNKQSLGIIIGGSGQGEAIAANKIKGIRAVVYYGKNPKILKLSKEHNNANILSLGARFLSEKEAINAIKLWLRSKFSKLKKHQRRIKKVDRLGS